jgi:ADP-heptose:LPS heptosyltransferase
MFPDCGVVFVGAMDEFDRSERVAEGWTGPKLNLCGRLTPRQSAVILREAVFFIGHDSGPMHLAAAVGTACVAIFSARNKPNVWFPYGHQHRVIYHRTDCYGCGLEVCERFRKKCIASITVREVLQAIEHLSSELMQRANKANVVRIHTAEEPQRISQC